MNTNSIKVKEKSVYGNVLIYPACDKSNIFAGLIGKKTFTTRELELIKALGFEIELIALN